MSAVAQHDGSAFTALISLLTALTLSNASLRCSASVDNRPYRASPRRLLDGERDRLELRPVLLLDVGDALIFDLHPTSSACRCRELDLPVVPYNGGEAPIDKERFVNARAEDYWTLRELFEQNEVDIDPDDDKLVAQLGSIKWGIDSRGRIKIESQDDMRKRGLPSPDRADTAAMIFSARANAAPMDLESHVGESITGDLMTKAW
jgi:hypothetical protein